MQHLNPNRWTRLRQQVVDVGAATPGDALIDRGGAGVRRCRGPVRGNRGRQELLEGIEPPLGEFVGRGRRRVGGSGRGEPVGQVVPGPGDEAFAGGVLLGVEDGSGGIQGGLGGAIEGVLGELMQAPGDLGAVVVAGVGGIVGDLGEDRRRQLVAQLGGLQDLDGLVDGRLPGDRVDAFSGLGVEVVLP